MARMIRLDINGIPLSPTGRRWMATMLAMFPREVVMSVLIDATTYMSKRGGRQVTRDDLNAALAAADAGERTIGRKRRRER